MSEVEYEPTSESAFPRPTSLFQPERFSPSLLDSSSYSPFPTVSGSRSDPFGLNAYLLHPEDQLWAYLSPTASATDLDHVAEKEKPESPKSRIGGLKKTKSSAALRKGSPLSQPSVVSAMPVPERTLERRRSQSMDSTTAIAAAAARDAMVLDHKSAVAAAVGGKKGFARLFGRRKSISSLRPSDTLDPVPTLPVDFTPSSSVTDLSTPPQSNRSSLLVSEHGSTSSSRSSVYDLQTPQGSPSQSTDSLTEAIAKAESGDHGSLKRRGLMGWLGRRTLKMPSSALSSAESSPSVSPNNSTTNLVPAPPSVIISVDPPSRISPTPDQIPYAWIGDQMRRASYRKLAQLRRPSPHPLAQQLRRQTSHLPNEVASSFEVGQVMYPRSINPRGLSEGLTPAQQGLWCLLGVKLMLDQLDRGAIPSGTMAKRTSQTATTSERKPRGMRDFTSRPPFEDRYLVFYPDDIWSPVSMARPGFGVWDLDFSKYIQSLADSGDVDARASWPKLPRPSFLGSLDGMRSDRVEDVVLVAEVETVVIEVSDDTAILVTPPHKAASISSNLSDDSSTTDTASTMINTPLALDGVGTVPEIKIDFDGTEFKTMSVPAFELERDEAQAESSFRRPKVIQQTWEESDDEEDDEEEEPEAEVRPLRNPVRTSSAPPQSGMKASTSAPNVRESLPTHSRRISQPIPSAQIYQPSSKAGNRRSQFDVGGTEDDRQRRAMAEVAKARERRQALQSGEVDRRAEGELRRKEEAKRRSAMPPPMAPIRPQSTGGSKQLPPSAWNDESRQRTKSLAHSSSPIPIDQPRASIGNAKRYHSFYESPSASGSPASTPPSSYIRGASHPSPHQFHSPSLPHHPGMVHSASMGFVPSHMGYYPQPMAHHAHGQAMYFPPPPTHQYGYNPAMGMGMGMAYGMSSPIASPHVPHQAIMTNSHSTLSLPEQQRRQRQRSSYA